MGSVTSADSAYSERNSVVATMAWMALSLGWRAGLRKTQIDGWEPEWDNCVWIDFPTGQASWHYHDDEAFKFAGLPNYNAEWDGHHTAQKYARLQLWREGKSD